MDFTKLNPDFNALGRLDYSKPVIDTKNTLVKIYPLTYISHPIRFRQGTKHAYNFGKTELYVYFCCQYEVQIPRGRRCATRFSA